MGFRKEATHFKLNFEDPDLKGLEVTTKSLSVKELMNLARMQATIDPAKGDVDQLDEAASIYQFLADSLVEWNLETENGDPVPANYDGIMSQETDFISKIVVAWMTTVAGVPKDSNETSSASETSEASIPMEVSSPNRGNSRKRSSS